MIGAIALSVTVVVLRPAWPSPAELVRAPITVWLGGLLAVLYILAIVLVTPKLGVGRMTVLIVAGQVLAAVVLDHFGAFGNAEKTINLWRAGGAVPIVAGVAAIQLN